MANEYGAAQLPDELVQRIQEFESELRQQTGNEIVVIAYEQKPEPQKQPN